MREICIPKFFIENGTYALIPRLVLICSFHYNSAKSAGLLGEFTINIYFDCKEADIELTKVDDSENKF